MKMQLRRIKKMMLWAMPIFGFSLTQAQPSKRLSLPNIVLIMADDLGKECIGVYGSTYETPHIDELAREGLKFNYAFSQPLCTPSRVQLMTGKYNYKNYTEFGYLNPDQHTFAHLAKKAGYVTAIAGKWQLGFNNKLPAHFGFDNYCLWQLSHKRSEGERYVHPLIEQDGKRLQTGDADYGPDIFTDYLLEFIEKNKDKPFLAYYPMALVHDPFLPTPDDDAWKEGIEKRSEKDTANFRHMVRHMDKNIGKIIQKLKELHLYENTLIIFTGDNGTGRSVFTPMRDGTIIRGGKGLTVDRGDRVPLIVHSGQVTYLNHATDDLVDFTDFLPTIAEALNEPVPETWDTDGKSFYAQVQAKNGTPRKWVFTHYNPLISKNLNKQAARYFRDHRYKRYQDGRFYDLLEDPEEIHPIAQGAGSAKAELARKLFEDEFARLPPWQPGDPGVPKITFEEAVSQKR